MIAIVAKAYGRRLMVDAWLAPIVVILAGALARLHLEYMWDLGDIFLERLQDPPSTFAYGAWLLVITGLWSFIRPTGAWRWALLAGMCLPAWVYLTPVKGTYLNNQLASLYLVVPMLLLSIIVAEARRRFDRHIIERYLEVA